MWLEETCINEYSLPQALPLSYDMENSHYESETKGHINKIYKADDTQHHVDIASVKCLL